MTEIFEEGAFSNNRISDTRLSDVISETRMFNAGKKTQYKRTVFLSHKHDDLVEMKDFIGFLEKRYDVSVYIDSKDPGMPNNTSGETAVRLKSIIKKCDRFILLATDNAIDSKWYNWELGFGDAHKYKDNIAILPIKKKGTYDFQYKGNEYLYIYPYIAYYDGTEKYTNGNYVKEGYYVVKQDSTGHKTIDTLYNWLR